jgi:mRNA-degrading endonuclease YafQ of YafQ-DinJ toxin-antitoxin module
LLDFAFTNQFKKDLKLMEKRRKDLDKIYAIMALLIWEEPLPNDAVNTNFMAIGKVLRNVI